MKRYRFTLNEAEVAILCTAMMVLKQEISDYSKAGKQFEINIKMFSGETEHVRGYELLMLAEQTHEMFNHQRNVYDEKRNEL